MFPLEIMTLSSQGLFFCGTLCSRNSEGGACPKILEGFSTIFLDVACEGVHGILTTRSLTKFSNECICVIFMATYTQYALAIKLVNAQVACYKYLLTAGQFDQVANFLPREQKIS